MRGLGRIQRWSGMTRTGWAFAAMLATAACAKGGESAKSAGGDSSAAAAGGGGGAGGAVPVIAIIRAADWIGSEWSEDALKVGLEESDLEQGRDYEFKISSAQGDLATLPSLIDAAVDAKAKVIVTLQDETLQAAVQRVKTVPIVFNILSDPFAAGAGTSDSNHLANITGVYSPGFGDPEQTKRIELIKRVVPKVKKVGILFSPAEPLSVGLKDKMTEAAKKAGLSVETVPINNVSEGTEAATALVSKKVDAVEIYGNAAHGAFESIIQVARDHKVPVFSPSPFEILKGATAAFYPDFQLGGVEAGKMIGRILKGESPGKIPFYRLTTTKEQVSGSAATGK
ncbi:MAG TPA: ABC transporter substrate-binding protein [Gemmatimonadales bacterium]|nr:ABC transporter substrate-binding protein [Gemmatimonadales bacterium]